MWKEFYTNSSQYKSANIANFCFSCVIRNELHQSRQNVDSNSLTSTYI